MKNVRCLVYHQIFILQIILVASDCIFLFHHAKNADIIYLIKDYEHLYKEALINLLIIGSNSKMRTIGRNVLYIVRISNKLIHRVLAECFR